MAMIPGTNGEAFKAEEVSTEDGGFEPIPAGDYEALILNSEARTTKRGDGSYLSLCFKIINHDEYENRLVWCNLNLDNPSPRAVEIAQRDMAAICRATGVLNPEDSSELHGIPLMIHVKVRPATESYPAGNDVNGFKELGGDAPW